MKLRSREKRGKRRLRPKKQINVPGGRVMYLMTMVRRLAAYASNREIF